MLMPVELCTVGGYSEVGRNMTAVKYKDEVVILDMGLQMEKYITLTEDEDLVDLSAKKLMDHGAVPDLRKIDDWKEMVKAIVPGHAHLDHIGAIPFLGNKFKADILCTPFTKAVLESLFRNEDMTSRNPIKGLPVNSLFKVSPNIHIELIHTTHSTPQTAMIAVHTPDGIVLYTNDYKLDNTPVLGKPPNYARLTELGKEGNVLAVVMDSLYSHDAKKTPSESIARDMVKQVLLETETKGKAIFFTTFSSHIARLKTAIECGKKLNRKVVLMGRSLGRYVQAAEQCGIVNFSKEVEMVQFGDKIRKKLRKYEKNKDKMLFVVTGHQGEQKAVLSKLAHGTIPFHFDPGDYVVFSNSVIPTPINRANRDALESQLRKLSVRIFRDVHVSGHASREDHRDLITMVKPKNIIPSHCNLEMAGSMAELANEIGFKLGRNVHIMEDGGRLKLG